MIIDSDAASCLDWAIRCQDDGHQIKLHISPKHPRSQYVGRGLVERVDWREWISWADIIVGPDNTQYLPSMEALRERGMTVFAPNRKGAALELDRDVGMKALEKHGIQVPPSKEFSDYDAAIAYVKREGRRFVSKPSGVEGDKSLTYAAKDPADMVFMLERWKKTGKLKASFILQEFVKGVEFGAAGWFGPGGFIEGWEECFEHKPFMNDDIGPGTGEQGTVLRWVKRSKLANLVLKPLEEYLERIGYVGCVSVNCIIDDQGQPWPLEFTMRWGWPAFSLQQSIHNGDHAEWLVDLVEGRDPRCFDLDRIVCGIVVTLPDYPSDRKPLEEVIGYPLYGITEDNMDAIHPHMMMRAPAPCLENGAVVTKPCLCSAGTYLLTVTGTGATVKEAQKGAYEVLKEIRSPGNPQYRSDIGRKCKPCLPELQKHGFAVGMEYG